MPARNLELEYPVAGQDRRLSLQKQRPFTSVYERNMRSDDPTEGRRRGGKRPGLVRAFAELLDSGKPIWLLGQLREITAAGGKFWEDGFDVLSRVLGAAWEAASWRADGVPGVTTSPGTEGFAYAQGNEPTGRGPLNETGGVRKALSDFDATKDYEVSMMVLPQSEGGGGGQYQIYVRLDDTTPDVETNGILVEILTPSPGSGATYTLNLISFVSSAIDATLSKTVGEGLNGADPGILKVTVTAATNVIKVFWRGTLYITSEAITNNVGKRIGFGIGTTRVDTVDNIAGALFKVDWFKLKYEPVGSVQTNRNRVLAGTRTSSSAGKLYRENNDSTLAVVGSGTIQAFPEGVVQGVEFLGKFYWTTTGSAGIIQEYDPATDTIASITASAGTVPTKCPAIAVFQDRLVVAGDDDDPHVWYMSRFGDVTDWNYGASVTDLGRAVAGTSTDQMKIAQPVLALASLSDDYLIFGCISSLWLMRGSPAVGGTISPLSKEIGIIQNMAWCPLPVGGIAFMSRDGLYHLPSGGGTLPRSISREKLPRELVDLDNVNNAILMAYDARGRGIHIAVTPLETGTGIYYWLNWETGAFHPVELQSDHEPLSMMSYYADSPSRAGVLYGCRDGYVRMFSNTSKTDDGVAMTSEVDYGPIPLNRGRAAMVDSVEIVLDDESDDVSWTFRSGNSPEEANTAATRAFGTAKAGVNYRQPIRHFGEWGFLRLSTTKAVGWAVEGIKMRVLTVPTEARKF